MLWDQINCIKHEQNAAKIQLLKDIINSENQNLILKSATRQSSNDIQIKRLRAMKECFMTSILKRHASAAAAAGGWSVSGFGSSGNVATELSETRTKTDKPFCSKI